MEQQSEMTTGAKPVGKANLVAEQPEMTTGAKPVGKANLVAE